MDVSEDLSAWQGVPRPERVSLEGRYTRLEPLDPARHGPDLLASAQAPGAEDRSRHLFDAPPSDPAMLDAWLEKAARSDDPLFFAVIDRATGRAEGRQALMRIEPAHGVLLARCLEEMDVAPWDVLLRVPFALGGASTTTTARPTSRSA